VADFDHENEEPVVPNLVENAIVSDAETVPFFPFELLRP